MRRGRWTTKMAGGEVRRAWGEHRETGVERRSARFIGIVTTEMPKAQSPPGRNPIRQQKKCPTDAMQETV